MASAAVSHTNSDSSRPKFHIIWLSEDVGDLIQKYSQSFTSLQKHAQHSFDTFTESDLCMSFIFDNPDEAIILIVNGALAEEVVQIIDETPQLNSIYIFCHNKFYHERWTKDRTKIKGVFTDIDQMCQTIEQTLRPTQLDTVHERTTASPVDDSVLIDRPSTDSASPLFNSLRGVTRTTDARSDVAFSIDDLERTLIATAEQKLRKTFLVNTNEQLGTSINPDAVDHLQHTLVPIIEKYVTREKDDSQVLNHLFADLKQVLVDTIVQQQQKPVVSQEIIRQTVLDVINEQNKLVAANPAPSRTTMELNSTRRRPITLAATDEVKINADLRRTRVDAAFRRERDAVVGNKRLRDAVQQWSSIGSMVDLVTTISTRGRNNLECAWLLFCWIGTNIRYRLSCNNNSAESVFRTREGVCRGFVSLYHECCSLLNIECSEISGNARQAFLKPGEHLNQSPHAWNSIILDGYTYLVDPTWGAGGGDNENKLEDFYFLTSPEEFIYTHYANGSQLLASELTREQFLRLPVVKSTYYRLGLTLISPKQGFNEINESLFKIVIRTPENVDLFLQLNVNNTEYPRNLHTLCQRDEKEKDLYNCYIAPPLNGLYEVAVYAKTNAQKLYEQTIVMRLRVTNIVDAFTFPTIYSTFTEHRCILIEPLQRLVYKDEEVLLHMIIPHANVLKIDNGDDKIVPCSEEYKRGVLRKKVRVQGDLHICARWNDNADTIEVLCVFNMF